MEEQDNDQMESNGEPYNIPIKERQLYTNVTDSPIKDLCDKINKGRLEIQADFQREYVWQNKPDLKSRLIESILLKVPIPIIYTAERKDGKEVVIDGQQRLRTFLDFCSKEGFRLSKLKVLEELNGKKYTDLPQALQDEIDSYTIRIIKIQKESHPDIKFDIFERLNRGSVKLSDQELRNCIYRGSFNDLLKRLVFNSDFLNIQNQRKPHRRMKDAERILRFFALNDKGIPNYKSPLNGFLNEYMEEKREILDNESHEKTELFKKCVSLCRTIFGDFTARRWVVEDDDDPNGEMPSQFNEGVFDAQMLGFVEFSKHQIMPKAQVIKDAYIEIVMGDRKFIETIEIGTYSTKMTKRRVEKWLMKLREIMAYEEDDRRLYTFEEKKKLFDTEKGICQICKNEILDIDDAHVDHIERYVDGGKTVIKNAQITHRFCNLSKG